MSESEKAAWAKNRTQAWRKAWVELINNMSADSLEIMYEDREDVITFLIDTPEFEEFTDELPKKRRKEVDSSSFSRLWQKLNENERADLLKSVHNSQYEEISYYTDPKLNVDTINSIVATFEEVAENERLLGGIEDDDSIEEDD